MQEISNRVVEYIKDSIETHKMLSDCCREAGYNKTADHNMGEVTALENLLIVANIE